MLPRSPGALEAWCSSGYAWPMGNKPPKDHEFGFRHLLLPMLGAFAAVPVGCGVIVSSVSERATFMNGFYFGLGMLGFALTFAAGQMIRKR